LCHYYVGLGRFSGCATVLSLATLRSVATEQQLYSVTQPLGGRVAADAAATVDEEDRNVFAPAAIH